MIFLDFAFKMTQSACPKYANMFTWPNQDGAGFNMAHEVVECFLYTGLSYDKFHLKLTFSTKELLCFPISSFSFFLLATRQIANKLCIEL